MSKNPTSTGPGRPKKYTVDLKIVEQMASYGCLIGEIALVLNIPERTVRRQGKDAFQRGKAGMKCRLRKAQFDTAINGNVQAQIWLGKQMLNQTEEGTFEQDELLDDVTFELDEGNQDG